MVTSGRLFARNSVLNLTGLVLPLVLGVLALPPLVRGFGAERFAILTLGWAVIGYFGLFEFGLSRALTQAVAHRIGNNQEGELPEMVWTSLLLLAGLGMLGAIAFSASTPFLVFRALNVPEALRAETIVSFYILAASLPFVVSTAGLRGIMEAHQHFGTVSALRAPLVALMFIGPLVVLPFSTSLTPVMIVLVAGRVTGWTLHLAICLRRYPYLRRGIVLSRSTMGPLLRYGSWTTLTNVVSPMMVFLDRFLIGAVLPIAAVTHYVTPYEAITKMTVIPSAILTAMFPAFAATFSSDRERMSQLYDRALRAVVIVTFPVLLVAVALAPEGMRLWMGNSLPAVSTTILQVLAIGIFVNSVALAPFAALQGAARPDLIAKLHLLELPVYVGAIWLLIHTVGLVGVAIAWTLRVTLDAVALLLVTRSTLKLPLLPERAGVWTIALMLAALGAAAVPSALLIRVVLVLVVGVLFATLAWRHLLTSQERAALVSWRAGGMAPPPSEEPA